MQSNKRILMLLIVIAVVIVIVIGVTFFQRQMVSISWPNAGSPTPLPAGAVPIYLNGELIGGFTPDSLSGLQAARFTDTVENKLQDGWLLKDILLSVAPDINFNSQTQVVVSSSSRDKSATLSWEEIAPPENLVMFDISNRGTLKLVSTLPQLDGRDEWVQDVDRIEIKTP